MQTLPNHLLVKRGVGKELTEPRPTRWWQGWDLPGPSHRFLCVIALEFGIICGVAQAVEKREEEPPHPKLDF